MQNHIIVYLITVGFLCIMNRPTTRNTHYNAIGVHFQFSWVRVSDFFWSSDLNPLVFDTVFKYYTDSGRLETVKNN